MEAHYHQKKQQDGEGRSKNEDGGSYKCREFCTRWTPTAEQLRILRDIYYKERMRSPCAEEIEGIWMRLRQLGKIGEKNVFYWFQNQRNREKQQTKRLAAGDLQQQHAGGSSSSRRAAKRSKPPAETLPLFPMHGGDAVSCTNQDNAADYASHFSLDLTLRPYSPTP